jgi:hypothetical protein
VLGDFFDDLPPPPVIFADTFEATGAFAFLTYLPLGAPACLRGRPTGLPARRLGGAGGVEDLGKEIFLAIDIVEEPIILCAD